MCVLSCVYVYVVCFVCICVVCACVLCWVYVVCVLCICVVCCVYCGSCVYCACCGALCKTDSRDSSPPLPSQQGKWLGGQGGAVRSRPCCWHTSPTGAEEGRGAQSRLQ